MDSPQAALAVCLPQRGHCAFMLVYRSTIFRRSHHSAGAVFRFDPRAPKLEVVERITSEPSRRGGMNDSFGYGYLGFTLCPDGRTVYYLTTGPSQSQVRGRANEDLRLETYDMFTATYRDCGAVFLRDGQRPTGVQSIAVAKDGSVYCLATFSRHGKRTSDLIRIRVQ